MRNLGLRLLLTAACVLPVLAPAQNESTEPAEEAAINTQYVNIKPAFIANYGGPGRLRYLKTDVTLRVGDSSIGAVRRHMPYIRHVLVMLLTKATDEEVSSMEGRELLRQNALMAVQTLLQEEEGEQYVVDLLFNSFIVQR